MAETTGPDEMTGLGLVQPPHAFVLDQVVVLAQGSDAPHAPVSRRELYERITGSRRGGRGRGPLAWKPWIARGNREWNDANVLAMSPRRLSSDVAVEILDAFLSVDKPDESQRENIAALEPVPDSEDGAPTWS